MTGRIYAILVAHKSTRNCPISPTWSRKMATCATLYVASVCASEKFPEKGRHAQVLVRQEDDAIALIWTVPSIARALQPSCICQPCAGPNLRQHGGRRHRNHLVLRGLTYEGLFYETNPARGFSPISGSSRAQARGPVSEVHRGSSRRCRHDKLAQYVEIGIGNAEVTNGRRPTVCRSDRIRFFPPEQRVQTMSTLTRQPSRTKRFAHSGLGNSLHSLCSPHSWSRLSGRENPHDTDKLTPSGLSSLPNPPDAHLSAIFASDYDNIGSEHR